LLGVQAGVNYQFASNWVVGAEVDSAFVAAKGTVVPPILSFPMSSSPMS
jgi:hypothetical protein